MIQKLSRAPISPIWIELFAFATGLAITPPMVCQESGSPSATSQVTNAAATPDTSIVSDWSHHHVIYSYPGTANDDQRNKTYDRWLKITSDPRYRLQELKRSGAGHSPWPAVADTEPAADSDVSDDFDALERPQSPAPEEDLPDGALPRGLARVLASPPSLQTGPHRSEVPQFQSSRFEFQPEFRDYPVRPFAGKSANRLQKDWSENEGGSGTTGMGHFPATFTTAGASCTADFAVYNTGLAGSGSPTLPGQASIIAFNHLYSACSFRPSIIWAFNTGGTIVTSVVLSLDGTQIAFVQTDNTTSKADLVVLKWTASSGTLTLPAVPVLSSSYPNCTAPCMISLPLDKTPTVTYSSPFVDYSSGSIYVGDDAGNLHKFTNIFTSVTPVEVKGSWPVTLTTSAGAALGGPVYDSISGNIFVGDLAVNTSSNCQPGFETPEGECGYLYSVSASSAAVTKSVQLDYNLGIYDSPIVDPSAGTVYAFVGADNSTNCSNGPCAAVFQFPVGFSDGATGTEATVGAGHEALLSGAFDNDYFTSGGPPTGHLYVVGGTGSQNNTLYAIPISGSGTSTMGSATAGPVVATNYTNGYYATGLQVTEFCNNGDTACTASQGTDYLFLSVLGFGSQFAANPCQNPSLSNGCIMGFAVSGCAQNLAVGNFTLCGEIYNDVSTAPSVTVNYSPSPNNAIIAWSTWCFTSACNTSTSGITATIGDNINATESCFVASPHSPFITDGNGGVQGSGDFQQHYVWYCPSIPSGVTSFTVTPTDPNLSYLQLNITEWKAGSLAPSCSPISACFENVDNLEEAGNSIGGTTATITTSGPTANANDLIFAVTEVPCCSFNASPGTGYTGITVAPAVTPGMVSEAKATTSAGIQTATSTWTGGNAAWFGVVVPVIGASLPTSGTVSSNATPTGTLPEAGGTSGIVVDNGAPGASNIYFSTLLNETCPTSGGTGGCAVSATQAALH